MLYCWIHRICRTFEMHQYLFICMFYWKNKQQCNQLQYKQQCPISLNMKNHSAEQKSCDKKGSRAKKSHCKKNRSKFATKNAPCVNRTIEIALEQIQHDIAVNSQQSKLQWICIMCVKALSKELINLLLNNRMMSCRHLDIKVPKVMEQGSMGSKLKMVALNHIKHKPVGCNASPLIKKFEKHTNLKWCRCRGWGWRGGGPRHIRSTDPPCPPLHLDSVELVETAPPADFLPCRWASFPLSKWGCLGKDAPLVPGTEPDTGLFCNVELETSLWSGLATPFRRKGLRQTQRMSLCQRPINTAIETCLTRRNHLLKSVEKRELWSPNFLMLPGNRIKQMC